MLRHRGKEHIVYPPQGPEVRLAGKPPAEGRVAPPVPLRRNQLAGERRFGIALKQQADELRRLACRCASALQLRLSALEVIRAGQLRPGRKGSLVYAGRDKTRCDAVNSHPVVDEL